MTRADLDAALERNAGKADTDLALTIVGPSSRGLGVRPRLLEHRADGTKVYGLTVRQVRTLRDRLAEAGR